MDRKQKALQHINPTGLGVEIGPSYNPLASKAEGYRVHVIDHASREELVAKYKNHQSVDINKIEEVDFVWRGESYLELTGNPKYYDWIIASHVIEHAPDLIRFLNDCESILKDDGVLSLVIPDKRYCFDHYKSITGISKIIDNYFQRTTKHTPGTVVESFLNEVTRDGRLAWSSISAGDFNLAHSVEDARQVMNATVNENNYLDVHAWCFVPHSFRLIIHDLFCLGFISLKELDFHPTDGFEFFITLARKGEGIDKSRLEMLEIIERETTHSIKEQPHLQIKEVMRELITGFGRLLRR